MLCSFRAASAPSGSSSTGVCTLSPAAWSQPSTHQCHGGGLLAIWALCWQPSPGKLAAAALWLPAYVRPGMLNDTRTLHLPDVRRLAGVRRDRVQERPQSSCSSYMCRRSSAQHSAVACQAGRVVQALPVPVIEYVCVSVCMMWLTHRGRIIVRGTAPLPSVLAHV